MSLFSKLFGGSTPPPVDPEDHNGFRIYPAPKSDAGGYRIGARIEREIDGEVKVHHMLRADTVPSAQEAEAFSIRKAKQLIDEQGDRLFG